jgi:hypothetical protein
MNYVLMLYSTHRSLAHLNYWIVKLPQRLGCLFLSSAIRVDFGVDINPNGAAVDLLRGEDSG